MGDSFFGVGGYFNFKSCVVNIYFVLLKLMLVLIWFIHKVTFCIN